MYYIQIWCVNPGTKNSRSGCKCSITNANPETIPVMFLQAIFRGHLCQFFKRKKHMLDLTNPCILSNLWIFTLRGPWKPAIAHSQKKVMTSGIYMLIASWFFSVLWVNFLLQTRTGSHCLFACNCQCFVCLPWENQNGWSLALQGRADESVLITEKWAKLTCIFMILCSN